jgi:hypothetical protein
VCCFAPRGLAGVKKLGGAAVETGYNTPISHSKSLAFTNLLRILQISVWRFGVRKHQDFKVRKLLHYETHIHTSILVLLAEEELGTSNVLLPPVGKKTFWTRFEFKHWEYAACSFGWWLIAGAGLF